MCTPDQALFYTGGELELDLTSLRGHFSHHSKRGEHFSQAPAAGVVFQLPMLFAIDLV